MIIDACDEDCCAGATVVVPALVADEVITPVAIVGIAVCEPRLVWWVVPEHCLWKHLSDKQPAS